MNELFPFHVSPLFKFGSFLIGLEGKEMDLTLTHPILLDSLTEQVIGWNVFLPF